jgi:dolichol kinase
MFLSRALFRAALTVIGALAGIIAGLLLLLVVVGTLRGDAHLKVETSLMLAAGFAVGGLICWRLRGVFDEAPGQD